MPEPRIPREKQLELPEMPKPARNPMGNVWEITPYVLAPEVKTIADELIPQYHSERWKEVPEILYIFSYKAPKAHGEDATATCRKVGGLNAWLYRQQYASLTRRDPKGYNEDTHRLKFETNPHTFCLPEDRHVVKAKPLFVITWHWAAWQFADEGLRIAVTDHELYHVGVDFSEKGEGMRYHIIPHTVEEFDVIALRYGAYGFRLKMFQEALAEGERERRSR